MLCLELCSGHRSRKEFVCCAIYTLPTPSTKPHEIVKLLTSAAQGAAAECGTLTKLIALQIRHTSFSPQQYPIINTISHQSLKEAATFQQFYLTFSYFLPLLVLAYLSWEESFGANDGLFWDICSIVALIKGPHTSFFLPPEH